jgi:hypothetical protein
MMTQVIGKARTAAGASQAIPRAAGSSRGQMVLPDRKRLPG